MSDLPSQYAEEIETFRHILKIPDPRDTMPRFSTAIMGLDHEQGQQELRPRGPSAINRTFRPQIYLRINISNPLLPLQSGTRWDDLVLRTKCRS